jgi:cytochrome b involved in lipid metabolism
MVFETYSKFHVSLHNTEKDAWVIYKNKVYDITPFLKKNIHPASNNPIIKKLGTDITNDINFHSKNAKKMLKKYKKGELKRGVKKKDNTIRCCIL